MNVIALGLPGPLELLFILIVFGVPAALLLLFFRLGSRGREASKPASGFPVADGPGTFRVIGVDRETRADKDVTIEAASSSNARVKAELDGIVVTEVRRV